MATCHCDGPPHTYDPSWCVNPRISGYGSNRPRPPYPSENPAYHGGGGYGYDPRPKRPDQQAIDVIARVLGTTRSGWPERLQNDCRDGGCRNCQRFAREKAADIYATLVRERLM